MSAPCDTSAHLWEVEHPYYCEEDNYLGPSKCWPDYVSSHWKLFGGPCWDPELNLVFRWDWRCADAYREENGEAPSWGSGDLLVLFIMLQRKGHYQCVKVHVEKTDEPEVRAFLQRQLRALMELWAPLEDEGPS